MAKIRPFRAILPAAERAREITALPYDVFNKNEAREAVLRSPGSFLTIDRPETQFPEDTDIYAPEVYEKAGAMFRGWIEQGRFVRDEQSAYYVWEMTAYGRTQTGLVACSAVEDYRSGTIRRHEDVRPEKQKDRVCHIRALGAQTGPVLLTYGAHPEMKELLRIAAAGAPLYDFTDSTGAAHRIWRIGDDETVAAVTSAAERIGRLYIADGHHRASAAEAVARETDADEAQFFLTVMFPEEEMHILAYNRLLKDRNGMTDGELLEKLGAAFTVGPASDVPVRPEKKGEMGLFLGGRWYALWTNRPCPADDPVASLDVEYLQREALEPVWNIREPGVDPRIEYVGGIHGPEELEQRCRTDAAAAFVLYPTAMRELMAVADAGRMMPPKSTWFEPKLRTGLFIHTFF